MYWREFIVIMIIGIAISFTSFLLILRQIMETERTKKEIMSIFSILSTEDIKQVYDVCDLYLEHNFLGTGKL
jgi:Kef-type K+ transport system membrane component KefB